MLSWPDTQQNTQLARMGDNHLFCCPAKVNGVVCAGFFLQAPVPSHRAQIAGQHKTSRVGAWYRTASRRSVFLDRCDRRKPERVGMGIEQLDRSIKLSRIKLRLSRVKTIQPKGQCEATDTLHCRAPLDRVRPYFVQGGHNSARLRSTCIGGKG